MKKHDYESGLLLAGLLCFVFSVVVAIILSSSRCLERGGKPVRGMFWVECVEPRR